MRFALGQSGNHPILVLGLNPSTATATKSDLTLSKVRQISLSHGFDGFIMCNLCPIRSTYIAELPDRVPGSAYAKNLATITQFVIQHAPANIWAGWGTGITEREYFVRALREIIDCLDRSGVKWVNYGTLTKAGHPRHPSRVSYGASFHTFDVQGYAENIYKN